MNPALLALLLTVSQGLVADPTTHFAQLTVHTHPPNPSSTARADSFSYDLSDPSDFIGFGLLQSVTADSGGLELITYSYLTFYNENTTHFEKTEPTESRHSRVNS